MNLRFLVATLTALALAGCSDDTGLLVEVRGSALQVSVAKIETMVIVDDGSGNTPSDFDWGDALRVTADVDPGHDLRTTPYTVLLQPSGEVPDDASVWVTALAYDANGALVGWGQLDRATRFEPDLVKRVALELHPAESTVEGCVIKGGYVVVRTSDDCDRDLATYEVDCDDSNPLVIADLDGDPVGCFEDCDPSDPNVYPGNREQCDAVDNDCDDTTVPLPLLCAEVVREGDVIVDCRVGAQICSGDGTAGADYGLCIDAPIDPVENHDLCARWDQCNIGGADPACLVDGRLHCKLAVDESIGPCLPTHMYLGELVGLTCAGWRLIGNIQQGPWNVGLRAKDSADPIAPQFDGCDAELVVEAADLVPRLFVLAADNGDGSVTLFSIVIEPRRADAACDPTVGLYDLACESLP